MKRNLALFLVVLILASSFVTAAQYTTGDRLTAVLTSQQPDPVEPGNFVELRFTVTNNGATENNVVFVLEPTFPLVLLDGDDGIREVGSILGTVNTEDAVSLYYKLRVDSKAVAGDATVKLSYKLKSGASLVFDEFDIRVREPQAFLTIDTVETEPSELLPGQVAFITLGLTNYARFTMRNIWLTMDTSEVPFSGFETSNERFIVKILPGETVSQTFKVIIDGDAESKVHDTPIALQYQDDIGTEYSRDVEVGLIVNEKPKYLMNIEESTVVHKDQTGDIVFSISNTGTADINFAILELLPSELDEYEIISAPRVYVGNLESDDFETIDYKVHVDGIVDTVPFRLRMHYKDNFNNEYEKDHQLLLKVYSKRTAGKFGLADVPGVTSYIFSFMVMVLVIVFTVFMVLDWMHNKMPRYKRILWLIVILTPGIGALAYYFFGRKKSEL